jgi:hypothetical protein
MDHARRHQHPELEAVDAGVAEADQARLAGKLHDAILQMLRQDRDATPEFIAALHLLSERTGQKRFRHAASVLRAGIAGRSSIDDRAALARIARFPASRQRDAVAIVARELAGKGASNSEVVAIAQRLRRKRNQMNRRVLFAVPTT